MTTTIKPGLLVALRTSVSGGVSYARRDLESGDVVSRWETTKTVVDAKELQTATVTRAAAGRMIRRICASTDFGLVCPIEKEQLLDAAIASARALCDEHNEKAQATFVRVYTLKGRIASTDEEAVRAIGAEVSGLLAAMNQSIDRLDPKAIREAATRAKELSAMLGEQQEAAVLAAVDEARRSARQIVARVEKGGELAATVLADLQREAIEKARFSFIDVDEDPVSTTVEPPLPAIDVRRFDDVVDEASGTSDPMAITVRPGDLADVAAEGSV
jgi:hypothetical protein